MPIKRPSLGFEESRQRSRQATGDDAKAREIYADTKVPSPGKGERAATKTKPTKAFGAAPTVPIGQPNASHVMVGIDVPHPEPGYCATYDEMVDLYGADRALRAVFKQSFDTYMHAVETVSPAELESTYPHGRVVLRTSRKIDVNIFARLRSHYDRFNLLSAREIGKRVATAAVGAYLDKQNQEQQF